MFSPDRILLIMQNRMGVSNLSQVYGISTAAWTAERLGAAPHDGPYRYRKAIRSLLAASTDIQMQPRIAALR
jgi:hypothetical protein